MNPVPGSEACPKPIGSWWNVLQNQPEFRAGIRMEWHAPCALVVVFVRLSSDTV